MEFEWDPDKAARNLAKHGVSLDEWKPLLLWHMTRDEFLVRDFVETWLFGTYEAGTCTWFRAEAAMPVFSATIRARCSIGRDRATAFR